MESDNKQLHRTKINQAFLHARGFTFFYQRTLKFIRDQRNCHRGMVDLSSLFLLGIIAVMVATTMNIHFEIARKQTKLMQEFQREWNRK